MSIFIVIQQSDNGSRNPGSRDDLVLNTPVVLSNQNNTGITSWVWQLIDKPTGSTAVLSTPTSATSGFTPDVSGTYLIKLSVNNGLLSAASTTAGAAIKTTNLHYRIPAAQEEEEFDSTRGWAGAVNDALQKIDTAQTSGGGVDGYGTANQVAFWSNSSTLTSNSHLTYDNSFFGVGESGHQITSVFWGDVGVLSNLDTFGPSGMFIGSTHATSVNIASSSTPTNVLSNLFVDGYIDRLSSGFLNIGQNNATGGTIGKGSGSTGTFNWGSSGAILYSQDGSSSVTVNNTSIQIVNSTSVSGSVGGNLLQADVYGAHLFSYGEGSASVDVVFQDGNGNQPYVSVIGRFGVNVNLNGSGTPAQNGAFASGTSPTFQIASIDSTAPVASITGFNGEGGQNGHMLDINSPGNVGGDLLSVDATGNVNIKGSLTIDGYAIRYQTVLQESLNTAHTIKPGTPVCENVGALPGDDNRVNAISIFIPSDVLTATISIGNNILSGGVGSGFTSSLALYTSDGTGSPSGSPLMEWDNVSVPGDGSLLSLSYTNIVRGTDGKVVLLYTIPGGSSPALIDNVSYGTYFTTPDAPVVNPPPTPTGANPSSNLSIHFDYDTSHRRFVAIGDSIAVGYNSGYETSAFYRLAAGNDVAIDIDGVVGAQIAQFAAFADNPFFGWNSSAYANNDIIIQLGTNDLTYNDLSTMQSSLSTLITHIQSLTTGKIYAWTIPPQAAYAGTDSTRVAYNTWLTNNYISLGLTAIYDAAASVSSGGLADNSDPNVLNSSFDSGDGTHPNVAGQTQIMNGWAATVGSMSINPIDLLPQRSYLEISPRLLATDDSADGYTVLDLGVSGMPSGVYQGIEFDVYGRAVKKIDGNLIVDGYTINISAGANNGDTLVYNGTAFVPAAGGGSVAIGSSISGGTANDFLFLDGDSNLSKTDNFKTDGNNLLVADGKDIRFTGLDDGNWRIGRNLDSPSSYPVTPTRVTSNAFFITMSNTPGEGIIMGINGGQSVFEMVSDGSGKIGTESNVAGDPGYALCTGGFYWDHTSARMVSPFSAQSNQLTPGTFGGGNFYTDDNLGAAMSYGDLAAADIGSVVVNTHGAYISYPANSGLNVGYSNNYSRTAASALDVNGDGYIHGKLSVTDIITSTGLGINCVGDFAIASNIEAGNLYISHNDVDVLIRGQVSLGSVGSPLLLNGDALPPVGNTFRIGSAAGTWRDGYFGVSLNSSWFATKMGNQLSISSNAITPTSGLHHVDGTIPGGQTIKTIDTTNVPAGSTVELILIADSNSIALGGGGGNIMGTGTIAQDTAQKFVWDGGLWYMVA